MLIKSHNSQLGTGSKTVGELLHMEGRQMSVAPRKPFVDPLDYKILDPNVQRPTKRLLVSVGLHQESLRYSGLYANVIVTV